MDLAEANRIYGNRDSEQSDVIRLIDLAFQRFAESGEWPEVEKLQHDLDRLDDDLDVDEVGRRLPGYLGSVNSGGQPRRVALTLRGIRKAEGSGPVLNDMVRLIQEAYRCWKRDGEAARLRKQDMLPVFQGDELRLRRAFTLALQVPGAIWSGSGGPDDPWDRQVTSAIRPYRKLVTINELLAILYPSPIVEQAPLASVSPPEAKAAPGRRIFIVHGHDVAVRNAIDAFLSRIGAETTVLSVKAHAGKTLAEKLEAHALVDYAVVILSPDDDARDADVPDGPMRHQARQNVILELGYFIGSLGRARVAAIRVGDVALPSDLHGVGYIRYRQGWELELMRELQLAGLPLDFSKA